MFPFFSFFKPLVFPFFLAFFSIATAFVLAPLIEDFLTANVVGVRAAVDVEQLAEFVELSAVAATAAIAATLTWQRQQQRQRCRQL